MSALVLCALPLAARAQVQAKATVLVQYEHSLSFTEPGVTAAYSLDTDVVEAQAIPGGYKLAGRAPGQANVIVVTVAGVHTLLVTVPAPQIHGAIRGAGSSVPGEVVEFGQTQILYNNSPNQITSMQDMTQIQGTRTIHIQVTNTNIFPANGESPVGFPLLSYQIERPHHSLTLVDQMVDNTDLTMNGILLRGLHGTVGPWEFHAGITSVTAFQDFLLPGNRYEVAGISRHSHLSPSTQLEGNFYYFKTNTSVNYGAKTGGIGTLAYQYAHGQKFKATAEVGIGNGLAFSGKLDGATQTQEYHFDLHYLPSNIASLGIDLLHGRTANFNWNGKFHKRFQTAVSGSDTDINLAVERQLIDTGNVNEIFWANPHIGLMGGLTASRFISIVPSGSSIRSKGFVAGPQLQWKYLGGSFQYQVLHNSGNTPDSHNYSITAQTGISHMSLSAFYNAQTQTPVLAPVQSSDTSLQELLQHESASAVTPEQMAHFMRIGSSLTSQGYAQPVTVGIATGRKQYGSTLNWSSDRAGRLSLNTLINTSTGGSIPSSRLVTAGVTWTHKLGPDNVLNAGVTLFHNVSGGTASTQPVVAFSLQHKLFSIPHWILPARHGAIQGYVYEDASYTQQYASGDRPLAGVLVYMDGHRSTHTDASGHYIFRGVPYGMHRVEADFRISRQFFYTGSNPRSVITGDTADFGVNFAHGHIFGSVINDAGQGLQVTLQIIGNNISREVVTESDGSFEVDGLPDGVYTVRPEPGTFPPGYTLTDLEDQQVKVTADHAGRVVYRITAQRSASGQVTLFDPVTGQHAPLAGAELTIDSLQRTAHTDSQGRFLFRSLPAGKHDITVHFNGELVHQSVTLEPNPDVENNLSIQISHPLPKPVQPAPSEAPEPPTPSLEQHRQLRYRHTPRSHAEHGARRSDPNTDNGTIAEANNRER